MQYNTQRFTQVLLKYIEGGFPEKALELLKNCLASDNIFFNDILTLQSEYAELKRREYLGLDSDKTRMRQIGNATIEYLRLCAKHYSPNIELVYFPSEINQNKKSTPQKKRTPTISKRQQNMAKNIVTQTKSRIKELFMYLGILCFLGLIIYLKYYNTGSSEENNSSILSSEKNVRKIGEAIFIDQYERFEEAFEQKKQYDNSKKFRLSIIKVTGEPMPFKIIVFENGNLSSTMVDVKKIWPNARIRDFSRVCQTFKYDDSLQCFRCDQ